MVQILPNNQKRSFGEQVLSGLNEAVPGIQNFLAQQQQQQLKQEQQQAIQSYAKQIGIEGDISKFSPEMQKEIIGKQLQGLSEKSKAEASFDYNKKLEEQKHGYAKEIEDLKITHKTQEGKDKRLQERKEKIAPYEAGLDTIKQMKQLRKKGNLGLISKAKGIVHSDTRKDRGKYERLGKSLISLSSNIPIRNQAEFETLANDLYDPNITDAAAEGILDAMEKIITNSMAPYLKEDEEETPRRSPKQNGAPMMENRPPLTSFMQR